MSSESGPQLPAPQRDEDWEAPPPLPPRRRLRNTVLRFTAKWGLIGVAVVIAAVVALGGVLWGQGKTALLRMALDEAVQRSEGRLKVEGVEGSLFGSMRIARLQVLPKGPSQPGPRIEAREVALDWSLMSLLQKQPYREPVIYSMLARSVTVHLPYSAEPLQLPPSLALPIAWRVSLVQIGLLRIESAQADVSQPPKVTELRELALRGKYSPKTPAGGTGRYEIDRIAMSSSAGSIERTRLNLEDQPPFRLSASGRGRTHWLDELFQRAHFQSDPAARGDGSARGDFRIEGELLDLKVQASLETYKTRLEGQTRLRMAAARPLASIDLRSESLDLRLLDVRAPRTDLKLSWQFEPVHGIPGQVQFENRAAGPFDKQQFPFSAGRLRFALDGPRLQIDSVEAALSPGAVAGSAGAMQLAGKGMVHFGARQQFGRLSLPDTDLDLSARDLDLSRLLASLVPTRLSGSLRVKSGQVQVDLQQTPVNVAASQRLDALGAMSLKGQMRLLDSQLRFESLQTRIKGASLSASGSLRLDASLEIDASGRAQGFRPSEFYKGGTEDAALEEHLRSLAFSGPFEIKGALSSLRPRPDVAPGNGLQVFLGLEEGSQALSRPLAGHVRARLLAQRVSEVDALLQSQGNQIKATGALGLASDRMVVQVDAPHLAAIDPRLKGVMRITGELRDSLTSPSVQAQLSGENLAFDGQATLGRLQGQVNLPRLADGQLLVRLEASRLKVGEFTLDRLTLNADGRAAEHQFRVEGRGEGQSVSASGQGRYFPQARQGQRYQAEIAQAEFGGRFRATLDSVMKLALLEDGFQLDNAQLRLAEGRLVLNTLGWRSGQLSTQGEARDMSLRQVERLIEDFSQRRAAGASREGQRPVDGLRLLARWQLDGHGVHDLSGRVSVSVTEVDTPGAVRLNLGQDNTADVRLDRGRLDGRLNLALPSVSFVNRYAGAEWMADGELRFSGRVQGTIEQPEYQGELTGRRLQLAQRSLGWRVSNGTLRARFDAKGFVLEQMRLESGQGNIELSGQARLLTGEQARNRAKGLPPLQGNFRMVASRLPIPLGPGQRLILSGDTQVIADQQSLRWVGKLQADEGYIELRSAGVPDLPSDVVLIDAQQKAAARAGGKGAASNGAASNGAASNGAASNGAAGAGVADGTSASSPVEEGLRRAAASQLATLTQDSPMRLGADLEIDLGKRLRISGGGVEARLEGTLSLKGILPSQPRAIGVVTVKEGTYQAYGQKLDVQRGVLRFQGELDNPSLDLVALRRFLPVEAGVQVTGTALSPRVRLISTPEVSDAEKLSWLVLGTGIDDARGGTQTLALQQAALSLLGNEDGGLSSNLAKMLGLDVITLGSTRSAAPSEVIGRGLGPLGTHSTQAVSSTSVQQNVLSIGKRLSSRVFLSYEQGLRGVWNLLRIQYDISNRLSIRAQTGTENAVDLLLFHWFD